MSPEALQLAAQVQPTGPGASAVARFPEGRVEAPAVAGPGFGDLVARGLGEVNGELLASQTDLQQLATGNVQNLHQIMIRLEESRLSFQLLLQVRNRLLEAYQDVMKMQV